MLYVRNNLRFSLLIVEMRSTFQRKSVNVGLDASDRGESHFVGCQWVDDMNVII